VALALQLVRESPSARSEIAGRYRYVLVDEFQDTNRAQAELVTALAEPHRNITVVGDDDQAIYAFRGAAIENILEFRDRYPTARTVVLRRNYRSLGPILDASYRLVRFNDPDRLEVRTGIAKRLRPQRRETGTAVRLEPFATGSEEADWIAGDIARRVAEGGAPRDHAVLVRANGHADPILRALNMAGVPWRFSGSSGLYARPEVRLLLSFLRTVADPHSSVDLYALASSDIYGIAGDDLTAVVNMARRRNRSVWDVFEEVERQPGILRLASASRAGIHRSSAMSRGSPRWPTSGPQARSCTHTCATAACWHGSPPRRPPPPTRPRQHRPLLRPDPRAVGGPRGRSGGVRRAASRDPDRGG
jgi:DNA helicase-2/ATP-dependent DNA helicase PcrA